MAFQLHDSSGAPNVSSWNTNENSLHAIPGADLNYALISSPLVTRNVSITGYNITSPYSQDATPIDGWILSLTSAVDISAANTSDSVAGSGIIAADDFADVLSVSLIPPESLYTTLENGTRTWASTEAEEAVMTWRWDVTVLTDLEGEMYANAREDDGSCSSTLPAECIEGMTAAPGEEDTADTGSCGSLGSWYRQYDVFYSSTINYPFLGAGSTGHAEGEVLAYSSEAVADGTAQGFRGRTYPIFISWGSADALENYDDPAHVLPEVSVACLNVESEESMAQVDYSTTSDATAAVAWGKATKGLMVAGLLGAVAAVI